MAARITVVGAGVIGLSCAVRLAEAGYDVDVLARELPLETTSAVAGGLWTPFLAEPVDAVARWAGATLTQFRALAGDERTGVAVRTGHMLGISSPPAWAQLVGGVPFTPETDPAPGHPVGLRTQMPLVNMDRYLPYLVGRLEAAGGTLTRLALAALPARGLVVNCTGLAARALSADPSLRPVAGQVVRVSDPGLDAWWTDEIRDGGSRPRYVMPHGTHVVLGGTAQDGLWSTTPDPATGRRILAEAIELVPQLRGATVLGHRIGLRPYRPTVRLDTVHELDAEGTARTVVHCYGHGGSGVTLSWGCADDVLAAVRAVVLA